MTKTFCDICGKTLEDDDIRYILSQYIQKSSRNISPFSTNLHYLNYCDVCDKCAEKIKQFIESLKKE